MCAGAHQRGDGLGGCNPPCTAGLRHKAQPVTTARAACLAHVHVHVCMYCMCHT